MRFTPKQLSDCKRKKGYDKKGVLTLRNYWYKKQHAKFKIYECRICKLWHITKGELRAQIR